MFILIKETNTTLLGNDQLFNILTDYDELGEGKDFEPIENNTYVTTYKKYLFWVEYLLETVVLDNLIEKAKKIDEKLFAEIEDKIINEVEWSNPVVCNFQAKTIVHQFIMRNKEC